MQIIKNIAKMSDAEIVEALARGDNASTQYVFYDKYRPLFLSIINKVFNYHVDYDEIVNELYCYLLEDDARRLRLFRGESTLAQWIKVTAIRYLINKRDRVIDNTTQTPPTTLGTGEVDVTTNQAEAQADLERLFALMKNPRYVYVIRRLMIDGVDSDELAAEMGILKSNLYNIKKRAMSALVAVAQKDKKEYGKKYF